MDSLHRERAKSHVLSYHDLLMDDAYHKYFTFANSASSDYRLWTASRLKKELIPLLDVHACVTQTKAKAGNTPDWTEFRRAGGALAIRHRHLSDFDFNVDVSVPAKPSACAR